MLGEKYTVNYGGEPVEFVGFNPLSSCLIKVRIEGEKGEGEGIWACIDPKDKADYDADVTDNESTPPRFAILRNESLFGLPWGTYIPVKFKGRERPECKIVVIKEEMPINKTETIEGKD